MSKKSGNAKNEKKKDRHWVNVQRGKSKRAWATLEFTLYTEPAINAVDQAIEPVTWDYREILGMLAHNGYAEAIGPINVLVGERIQSVIDVAEESAQRMERITREMAERMEAKITPRDMGEGSAVKMLTGGAINKKLAGLARAVDRAVIAADLAMVVDAVPYGKSREEVGKIIAHCRLLVAALKKIRECVDSKIGGEKIKIEDLVQELTQDLQVAMTERAGQLGITKKAKTGEPKTGEKPGTESEGQNQMPSSLRKALQGAKG